MQKKGFIRVENTCVIWNDMKIPLISGEFHYWRTPRDAWEKIADSIQELGLKVVSSYVPWNYHELEEGVYDFTGKTAEGRNLEGFLSLMERKNLKVFLRPGPFIAAEWKNGGVPDRAASFPRTSRKYLEAACPYLDALCEVIRPHLITRGGCIILCQGDNEPFPCFEFYGEELGAYGKTEGEFREYLKKRYNNSISELNSAWRSSYTDFSQACAYFHEACVDTELPMADRLLTHQKYYRRYADTWDFIGDISVKQVKCVTDRLKANGIDVPFSSNCWSPIYMDFLKMERQVGISGFDEYPAPFCRKKSGGSSLPGLLDILKRTEADSEHGNIWAAELQNGNFPLSSGYMPPQHFRFTTLGLCAGGLRGFNYYMLVNRDSWANSPVNERGEPGENFQTARECIKVVNTLRTWDCRVSRDVALLNHFPQRVFNPGNYWKVFNALLNADISFSVYDPLNRESPSEKILIYAGSGYMEERYAEKIRSFVENGGTLVAFSQYPDESSIADMFLEPEGARPTFLPVKLLCGSESLKLVHRGHCGGKVNFFCYGSSCFDDSVKEKIMIELADGRSFCCGYVRSRGRGKIVHVGCGADPEVLRKVLSGACGIVPRVSANAPGVLSELLIRNDGRKFVSVFNTADSPAAVELALSGERNALFRDIESGKENSMLVIAGHDARFYEIISGS